MKKFIIPLLLLVAVALFFTLGKNGPEIAVTKPAAQKAVQAVYATGTVQAALMIPIAPKISARLMSLDADEGLRVAKGDVMAQLEDTDIQESLQEAQARLDLAQKEYDRSARLAKSGALSKGGLEKAEAELATARAGVERTKAELSYLKLLAPEDGMIIRRDGEIGELITVDTPVFWITGGDKMRIETEVDEEDISLVQPGQRVVISADAFPGAVYEGNITSITPKGDPVARSYRVRVSLKDQTPLMIGMTAETNIITQEKENALMVPTSAVKGDEVWVKTGHTFEKRAVKTGIKALKHIEILSGVDADSEVAVTYDDVAGTMGSEKGAHCPMGPGGC